MRYDLLEHNLNDGHIRVVKFGGNVYQAVLRAEELDTDTLKHYVISERKDDGNGKD